MSVFKIHDFEYRKVYGVKQMCGASVSYDFESFKAPKLIIQPLLIIVVQFVEV